MTDVKNHNSFRGLDPKSFQKKFFKELKYIDRPQFRALSALSRKVLEATPPGSVVLDIGAGECQWKRLFEDCRYIGIDNCVGDKDWDYGHLSCIGDVTAVPVANGSVDTVLCMAVLGHVFNTSLVFNEAFRVLKPGGTFLALSEFAKAEHQMPFDFTRLTEFAIKRYGNEAGFKTVEVRGSNSFYTSILNMIENYAWKGQAKGLGVLGQLALKLAVKTGLFNVLYMTGDRKVCGDNDHNLFPIYFFINCKKTY